MFRFVTPLATLAAVLTHAVLGCCVHHAHAGEALGHGNGVVETHAHHGDEPHDGNHDDHGHERHGQDDGGGCHESDCSWLTAPFTAPPILNAGGFSALLDALRTSDVRADRVAAWDRGDRSGFRSGPGDRLRTRVFLL
ncbi:hypothetical protein [Alienimonas chondri]|uniref:Uncharacterized protein n=1 Tax=Alienimonas chondri TaxID=2681879 RepID=A0ABX1VCM3_9PLAN|nr:hypothetical protein [Alienimonas chondri]NNJ24977.1 hypothetical protein [Alienimonas chondri]